LHRILQIPGEVVRLASGPVHHPRTGEPFELPQFVTLAIVRPAARFRSVARSERESLCAATDMNASFAGANCVTCSSARAEAVWKRV
jgi:hypothetical protein